MSGEKSFSSKDKFFSFRFEESLRKYEPPLRKLPKTFK